MALACAARRILPTPLHRTVHAVVFPFGLEAQPLVKPKRGIMELDMDGDALARGRGLVEQCPHQPAAQALAAMLRHEGDVDDYDVIGPAEA